MGSLAERAREDLLRIAEQSKYLTIANAAIDLGKTVCKGEMVRPDPAVPREAKVKVFAPDNLVVAK